MQVLVLSIDNYENPTDFWNAVRDIIKILTENNYIIVFRYEDCGNYILEYSTADKSFGDDYPVWMSAEDFEEWYFQKMEKDSENNNNDNNKPNTYF